jgi:DnaJ-domain-containing protein 1
MPQDPRRLIARLAVAVMASDRRIGPSELAALEGLGEHELPALAQLDRLGLGALSEIVYEEIRRAETEPIDIPAVCTALRRVVPRAASVVVAALTELAMSDGTLATGETEALTEVARGLGLSVAEARYVVASVLAARPPAGAQEVRIGSAEPPTTASHLELDQARRVLGIDVDAGSDEIDAAYRRLVDRYNPAKVVELGCDFAALAVRTLAGITDAYDTAIAALDTRH